MECEQLEIIWVCKFEDASFSSRCFEKQHVWHVWKTARIKKPGKTGLSCSCTNSRACGLCYFLSTVTDRVWKLRQYP
jgi:hypothetical protein